ncbi:MAG: AbrB family transcriptional regulator [Hyphomicrobiaceae bacterium]
MTPRLHSSNPLRLLSTLCVAVLGGVIFDLANMPAPWITGSTFFVAVAAIGGWGRPLPGWLRHGAMVFLGTFMGNSITPETIVQVAGWPISLVGLLITVVAMMLSVSIYLERVHGFDPITARLACVPGNMPYVLALTDGSAADQRRVVVVQVIRLAVLLTCLPFVFDVLGFETVVHQVQSTPEDPNAPIKLAGMLAAGLLGGILFEAVRFPAGSMCGAMFASALVAGSGLLSVAIPTSLMVPGFIAIGASVGSNFAGLNRNLLATSALAGLGAVVVGTVTALGVAAPIAWLMEVPVAQVWLAYSPGGSDAMTILALVLGLEPTFVVGHHVIRMFGLGAIVPIWLRVYVRPLLKLPPVEDMERRDHTN